MVSSPERARESQVTMERVRIKLKNHVLKVINTEGRAEIRKSPAMGKEKEIPRTVATMNVLILEHL